MNDNRSRKVKSGLLQRQGFWAMGSSLLALCLVVGMLTASPVQADPVALQPFVVDIEATGPKAVVVNDTFTLDIRVHANGQQVDGVDADLTFDPTYLEVLSVTGDPSGLPDELYSAFDNTAGTVTHSRGILTGTPPSGTFRLCSIEFRAKALTPGTMVAFTGLTNAYFEGGSVLRDTIDYTVAIVSELPVGGVAYLPNRAQILAPWLGRLGVVAGLILGAAVVFRKVHGVA